MKIVAVVGPSGSGKTTLLARLVPELQARGLKVGAIKHTRKDVSLDAEGKDTWTLAEAGAGTVGIVTPSRAAVFLRTAPDVEALPAVTSPTPTSFSSRAGRGSAASKKSAWSLGTPKGSRFLPMSSWPSFRMLRWRSMCPSFGRRKRKNWPTC
jgi:alpha-D-ribose 1-methylphosphonate 5-triphosphate synthase subunit PhnL